MGIPAPAIGERGTEVAEADCDHRPLEPIIAAPRRYLMQSLSAGTAAALLSAVFAMWASKARRQDPTQPLNAVSHIVHGGRPPAGRGRNGLNTILGSALHFAASLFWAAMQATLFRQSLSSPSGMLASGAGTAALAYVVDYHVVNQRFRPGFERYVSRRALLGVYASFALGLALGGMAHHWVQSEE